MVGRSRAAWVFSLIASGCSRSPADAPPMPAPAASAPIVRVAASSEASASGPSPVASTSSSAPSSQAVDVAPVPPLLAADGAPLPQTETRPSVDAPAFVARTALLWKAIVADTPEVAAPAFFPKVAYEQVKAIPNPAVDWNARLMHAFERDLHAYHRKLGDDPTHARLLRFEVPTEKARWMRPGEEGNKLGYHRVLRSTLRFARADGTEGALDVTSMISWRGEWYVVHLAGFR